MTSLGRSSRKPKESSGRNSFPTAGDIAAESEEQPSDESSLTVVDDGSYQQDVEEPLLEAPALMAAASTVKFVKPREKAREPKLEKSPKPPREKKLKAEKAPKAAKATKPIKPPKAAKTPKPPRTRTSRSAVRLTLLAGTIGALGLILSVVLAVGALFIALDAAQGSAFFGHLADLCDALVGPLRDVFTFSGSNADKKESLVGWGLGSMGYLLIGRFIQSVLQSKVPKN